MSNTDPSKSEQLRRIIATNGAEGWETAWISHTTPWLAEYSQPPLTHLIKSGEIDFPRDGTALVPGCGKGYDAIFIGKELGLKTTGVDISPTAVSLANETHPSPPENVNFEVADFFEIKETYDLVYDYTFFQALPPALRRSWGAQMSKIVKPGGYLIELAFPTNATDVGPPYGIDENSHKDVLGEGWDKLVDRVPENSSETHRDKDRLLVWRRHL